MVPSQVLTKGLGFAYFVILARTLSIQDYGVYNFIIGTLIVFSYLCNFGVASSLQRFLPEYEKLGLLGRSLRTILLAHGFRLLSSFIVLSLAVALYDSWAPFFQMGGRSQEFAVFALGTFFLFQVEYFEIAFEALFLHPVTSTTRVLYTLVKVGGAFFALKAGLAVTGVLAAEALGAAAGLGVLLWVFVTRLYGPRRGRLAADGGVELRRLGRYSGINALVIPGGILYSHSMDYFVIAALVNPHELGLYALASRASRTLLSLMPQNVVQGIIRPAFYERFYSAPDRRAELNRMFQTLVTVVAAFLVPSLCLVSVTGRQFLSVVFGAKYADATPILAIFLLFNVFLILDLSSDLVLQAIERVEARLYGQVFALYNIAGALVLIQWFGVAGVAFATGSAQAMKAFFYFYMARKHAGVSIPWASVGRIALNSGVAAGVAFAVPSFHWPALHLVVALTAGGAAYVGMSFANNFMKPAEKQLFNKLCRRQVFSV